MKKENLEEFAYNSIMKLILSHHFQPGEFLLETEITELLNLKSRTPVHHALGQLVAKGFLDKKAKKGCFIPLPTPKDAEHVFSVRENLESMAAKSAAMNASDEEIQELELIIEQEVEKRKPEEIVNYSSINDNFHTCIARISKNRYLLQFSEHMFWRSNIYIFFFHYKFKLNNKEDKLATTSPLQHKEIFQAIKNRNPEEAGRLMQEHIQYTFNSIW